MTDTTYIVSMEPPFPHFMFGMLAAIREKSVKTYPVKKATIPSVVEVRISY